MKNDRETTTKRTTYTTCNTCDAGIAASNYFSVASTSKDGVYQALVVDFGKGGLSGDRL